MGSTDWKDAEPNAGNQGSKNNVLEAYVCCNFSGEYGAPQTTQGYPPQTPLPSVTSVPRSMLRFRCMRRLDPIRAVFSKFLLFLHKS